MGFDSTEGMEMVWSARVAAWVLAIIILILSVVPPGLRPETDLPHSVEHFTIFLATGMAFGLGYNLHRRALALGLVIFDGAVEIAQWFIPGRHARVSDFLVDAIATSLGVVLASVAGSILATRAR